MPATEYPRAPWPASAAGGWRNAPPREGDSLWGNLSNIAQNVGAMLRRAESWLDARGRGAWIAALIFSFVFVWPVGLALLAYMIWSKRMFSKSCRTRHADHGRHGFASRGFGRPTGNSAFDAYRADTLRRLEDEQRAFEDFLARLREAKDKAEFDQFMKDRARRATPSTELRDGEDAPRA